jgi:ArsR family transcriptional regulator
MYYAAVTTTTRTPSDLIAPSRSSCAVRRHPALDHRDARGGERCVCELQDELDAAQSRLSFHLRVLKEAGLITDRRDGRWSYYAIAPAALSEVHDLAVAMRPSGMAVHFRSRLVLQLSFLSSIHQHFLISEGIIMSETDRTTRAT